ncbi:hypothetical protein MHK_001664, partial [Candidatus Magnetomorum sp. HK-1]
SDSDGGILTVTVSSSDASLISNSLIDLAGSGSNTITLNSSAGIPQSFTMSIAQTSSTHAKITMTVMATDPQGLTSTQTFRVILSPPGSGNALWFEEMGDYIQVEDHNSLDLSSNFTYEFWYKPTTLTSTEQYPLYKSSAFWISISNYQLYFHAWSQQYSINYYSLSAGNWYHFAFTLDSSYTCKFYINGLLVGSYNGSNPAYTSTSPLYIGYNSSYPIYGYMDELRIWGVARTNDQIKDNMCRTLTGSEQGLVAYYRFDHASGTTLIDLSANSNNGILYSMDDSKWVTSEAPIGDSSAHEYSGTTAADFEVSIAHADGDQFTATGDGEYYTSLHVYMVNGSPNVTTPPGGWETIDSNRYFGVFPVAGNGTFSVTYAYTGNSYINNKGNLKLGTRTDNSTSAWSRSDAIQDTANGELSITQQTRSEFIMGSGVNPPNISGLSDMASAADLSIDFSVSSSDTGTLTITTSTSDATLISNLNLGGSGSSQLIDTFTANVSRDLTLTFDQSSTEHGLVTVTVIASSAGIATTSTFNVIVSPPGAGNALNFDGVDDYSETGWLPNLTNWTIETWVISPFAPVSTIDTGPLYANENFAIIWDHTNPGYMGSACVKISSSYYFASFGTLEANTWYHLAATYDGETLNAYKNGVLITSNTSPSGTPNYDTVSLKIAGHPVLANYFSGTMDEIRIWNIARTQDQIQSTMCKRLYGNETGLYMYYRCDNSSGTTLIDLANNAIDATLTNMDNSDWITSGASLGDDSAYDYAGSVASDYSVSIAHADGDRFTATGDVGTYNGIHVYIVNESPNTLTPPSGYTSIDTDHYYGVFPVGIFPTYSIAYNYTGNTYATDDSNLQITYRTNNTGSWTGFASTQYTPTTTVVKTGISAFSGISATEFILGRNAAPVIVATDEQETSPILESLMYHNLAMKDDGTVWAWGRNGNGEVGNGTTTNQSTPVSVTGLSNVIDIEAGLDFSLAVLDDGTVWEWGKNGYITGETAKSTPVQVTELENVIQLAAGHGHTLALKSDGTVWGWGRNNEGALGNGTTTDETDPVQISGL